MNPKESRNKVVVKPTPEPKGRFVEEKMMSGRVSKALDKFSQDKAEPLNAFFSNPENVKDFNKRIDMLCK